MTLTRGCLGPGDALPEGEVVGAALQDVEVLVVDEGLHADQEGLQSDQVVAVGEGLQSDQVVAVGEGLQSDQVVVVDEGPSDEGLHSDQEVIEEGLHSDQEVIEEGLSDEGLHSDHVLEAFLVAEAVLLELAEAEIMMEAALEVLDLEEVASEEDLESVEDLELEPELAMLELEAEFAILEDELAMEDQGALPEVDFPTAMQKLEEAVDAVAAPTCSEGDIQEVNRVLKIVNSTFDLLLGGNSDPEDDE